MVGEMTTRTDSAVKKKSNGRVKRLNIEARKLVEANAGTIAALLMEGTKRGDSVSTRLLLELALKGVDIEELLTKRPVITLAMRLAAEPQMPATSSDGDAETGLDDLGFEAA
jgi:hypothetical protein